MTDLAIIASGIALFLGICLIFILIAMIYDL